MKGDAMIHPDEAESDLIRAAVLGFVAGAVSCVAWVLAWLWVRR
jgi:hypothetical protein